MLKKSSRCKYGIIFTTDISMSDSWTTTVKRLDISSAFCLYTRLLKTAMSSPMAETFKPHSWLSEQFSGILRGPSKIYMSTKNENKLRGSWNTQYEFTLNYTACLFNYRVPISMNQSSLGFNVHFIQLRWTFTSKLISTHLTTLEFKSY